MNNRKKISVWETAKAKHARAVAALVKATKELRTAEDALFHYGAGYTEQLPVNTRDWLTLPHYLVSLYRTEAPAGTPPDLYNFGRQHFDGSFDVGALTFHQGHATGIAASYPGAEARQVLLVETPLTLNGRR